MAEKKITLQDIAARTGLSTSTVSRVLNGSILISRERTDLILRTAEELGYTKRVIRRHRSRAIMNVILFLPKRHDTYSHLFYDASDLISGIRDGFGESMVNIIVRLQDDQVLHENKKSGDIDACIYAFCEPSPGMVKQLRSSNVRTVTINRIVKGLSYVASDAYAGMHALASRIRQVRGAGAVVRYLGFGLIPSVSEERRLGLIQSCDELGLEYGGARQIDSIYEITPEFALDISAGPCSALCCFNDVIAVYFYQVATQADIEIPKDLSLTGYDDSPARQLVPVSIDTVSFSARQLGERAAGWLRSCVIEQRADLLAERLSGEYVPGATI